MLKKIRLMADYGCNSLWWEEPNQVGDFDPAMLPLSEQTVNRLYNWTLAYDARLNWDDADNSPELSRDELWNFELEGISLWKQLKKELGGQYEVFYFSDFQQKLIHNLEDLENERIIPVTESINQLVMR